MTTPKLIADLSISSTLPACKQALGDHYGNRLNGLLLFGSTARQAMPPRSDIDLLGLLKPPLNYFAELRTIVDVLYPLQLEASHWIAAKPATLEALGAGITQLYRNIQKEGIRL
jgi:predicted nucleotidyltransferase